MKKNINNNVIDFPLIDHIIRSYIPELVCDKYIYAKTNMSVFQEAMMHTSIKDKNIKKSYERLEYLGDAVLELVISQYLYRKTNYSEGHMSRIRSSYVCEAALDEYAKEVLANVHQNHRPRQQSASSIPTNSLDQKQKQ